MKTENTRHDHNENNSELKSTKYIFIAVAFTCIAVFIHSYLSYHHYELHYGARISSSFCNVNAFFNCDATSASPYSELFGIPMAVWGLFTNVILLLFQGALGLGWSANEEKTGRLVTMMSLFIAITSIVMASLSIFSVHSFCLMCAGTYLSSFLNLFFVLQSKVGGSLKSLFSDFMIDLGEMLTSNKGYLYFIVAIPALSYLANTTMRKQYGAEYLNLQIVETLSRWQVNPSKTFDESKGLIFQKEKQNPVMTIVEFADFGCSHCKLAYPTLHAFTSSHSDVRLIFKFFPLDSICNPDMKNGDGSRCHMAYLTFCAEKIQQKGWNVHHHLFDEQERMAFPADNEKNIQEISAKFKIDINELKKCVADGNTFNEVQAQAKEGAGIQGTPTIFVNGKELRGGQSIPVLEAAYLKIKKTAN